MKNNSKPKNIVEVCPDILSWWNFDKNIDIDPTTVTPGINSKRFYFICPECKTELYRSPYSLLKKNKDGSYSINPCQKCHPTQQPSKVNLVDAVPDIEKYWDYDKNIGKKPSDFGASASDKVWTKCPICGTSVQRNVRFTWKKDENGIGHIIHCRTCGKRSKNNSLIELVPDIDNYWIHEKNEHGPEYYTVSSGKKVYTRCPECNEERYTAICDLVQYVDGKYIISMCKKCWNSKPKHKFKSILEHCPNLLEYWNESNSLDPNKLVMKSDLKIYLHCPGCRKLLYRCVVHSFKKNKENEYYSVKECHKCANKNAATKRALQRNPPLIDECPEFKEWWDYENNDVDINKITRGSHYEAHLKCPACQVKMVRDVHSFVLLKKDGRLLPVACPECGYNYKGDPEDNLLKLCPSITTWWDYEANYPFRPEQFSQGSQFKAHLTCPDCGMKLYTIINSLVKFDEAGKLYIKHEGRCRKYRAMTSKNNLVKRYPQVKKWWNYEANNGEIPEEYTTNSSAQMHFTCPDCRAKSFRRISDALSLNSEGIPWLFKCPFCNDKKALAGYNSLADIKPELISEWSPNNEKKINEVLPESYRRTLWICPTCHGEYSALIRDRELGDNSCPYCKNKKLLSGYNSLLDKHAELINQEWCYAENLLLGITPDKILDKNDTKVWWKCPTCGRKYIMSVKDRLLKQKRGHIACHQCRGKRWKRIFNI